MKIRVLVDNNTYIDQYYYGEPGVSYYIEENGKHILFDTGYSDLFIKNANALDISLDYLDYLILSHGHDDHTRGMKYYFEEHNTSNLSILAHPDALKEKVMNSTKIGSPLLKEEVIQKCNLILSKEPVQISKNIIFLGEIPQSNSFECRSVIGKQMENKTLIDDYIMDDTALVCQSDNGIYIITGCSHSGICNIIEYAKQVCNTNTILGIIGGFHLFEVNDRVEKTIEYLRRNEIKELYPCHCTSFAVKAEIHKYMPVIEVGVGLELNW